MGRVVPTPGSATPPGSSPIFARGGDYEHSVSSSPFATMIDSLESGAWRGDGWPSLRRRLAGAAAQRDYPVLEWLAAAGATDYFAQVIGLSSDPSRGAGMGYSFATDRADGFTDADLRLIEGVLPAASLAICLHQARHTIAGGLLAFYLGPDAGRRVHAGAVERGSVQRIRAALWFADIRGFTGIADARPGLAVIEMLNETFARTRGPRGRGAVAARWEAEVSRRRDARAGPSLRPDRRRRDVRPRARRRRRGDGSDRRPPRGARRGGQAGRPGRPRAASRRGALRQYRRGRPARLHGDRPGSQRGRADRTLV